ncbi:MAG: chemotaxis protein CheC [Myxococcaceae bacterium]|nr:chemotaxis protein CheC [Myxococcaceae bacterium]
MISALPNDLQLDALREIANIGCGNAANALSRLMGGREVRIDVPDVMAANVDDVVVRFGESKPVFCISLAIEGDVTGQMVLVFSDHDADVLAKLLCGPRTGASVVDAVSALAEVGNIVASACLSAIGNLTRLRLLPSVPHLLSGNARGVVAELVGVTRGTARAVVIEARFTASNAPGFSGRFFVAPDAATMPRLFRALGL